MTLLLALTACLPRANRSFEFRELNYGVTGGIAGFDRQMRISEDGAFQWFEGGSLIQRGELASAERKRLSELISAIRWRDLEPRYDAPGIADALMEQVTLNTPAATFEILAGTGGSLPLELADLLAFLNRLMTDYRPKQRSTPAARRSRNRHHSPLSNQA